MPDTDPTERAAAALAALRAQMARYRPSMLDPHGDIMIATGVVLEAAEALEQAVSAMEAMRADWEGADEVPYLVTDEKIERYELEEDGRA